MLAYVARNWNVRGDGKFDQSYPPSVVELEVGRVDLSNLTAFSQGELGLLRQYLNKDHNWRHKLIIAERRALVGDLRGADGGIVTAASGYRAFEPMVGPGNTIQANVQPNVFKSGRVTVVEQSAELVKDRLKCSNTNHHLWRAEIA